MCESETSVVKFKILDLFSQLDDSELEEIEQWISDKSYKQDLKKKKSLLKSEKTLRKIGDALKKIIPFKAEMDSEKIAPPAEGDQADCNAVNTSHVDAFLYDDEDVEELVKEGKLEKFYCIDCHSRNVKELIYISHSLSIESLQYIFKVLLPRDLDDKQVLDIGSRLGAVLYGAYYFSNASTIIGIEMNKELCELQENIINQFSIDTNRIQVIHSDLMERHDIVKQSDIIIMNTLDFFVDTDKHKAVWYFLKKYMKKGSYFVVERPMADTLGSLEIIEDFRDWLNICKPNQLENEVLFEDCSELLLYTVN